MDNDDYFRIREGLIERVFGLTFLTDEDKEKITYFTKNLYNNQFLKQVRNGNNIYSFPNIQLANDFVTFVDDLFSSEENPVLFTVEERFYIRDAIQKVINNPCIPFSEMPKEILSLLKVSSLSVDEILEEMDHRDHERVREGVLNELAVYGCDISQMKTWDLDMLMSKLTECFSKDNSFQFSSKRRKENNEPSLSHNTNYQHDNTDDDGLSEDIKKCLSFENKEVGDGSSRHLSWYTRRRMLRANQIINSKLEQKDRDYAYLLYLFSDDTLSVEKREKIVKAYNRISKDNPASYSELMKHILERSCVRLFSRIIPKCEYCLEDFDDTHQFCPNCIKKGIISPLYKRCKTDKCQCNVDVDDLKKCSSENINISYIANLQCTHLRSAYYTYHCYTSIRGIIADLLHYNEYDSFMSLDRETIKETVKYTYQTKSHSLYTGENMRMLYERWGLHDIAKIVQDKNQKSEPLDYQKLFAGLSVKPSYDKTLIYQNLPIKNMTTNTIISSYSELLRSDIEWLIADCMERQGNIENEVYPIIDGYLAAIEININQSFPLSSDNNKKTMESIQNISLTHFRNQKSAFKTLLSDEKASVNNHQHDKEIAAYLQEKDADEAIDEAKTSFFSSNVDFTNKNHLKYELKEICRQFTQPPILDDRIPISWHKETQLILEQMMIPVILNKILSKIEIPEDEFFDIDISIGLRQLYDRHLIPDDIFNKRIEENFLYLRKKFQHEGGYDDCLYILDKILDILVPSRSNMSYSEGAPSTFFPSLTSQLPRKQSSPLVKEKTVKKYMKRQWKDVDKKVISIEEHFLPVSLAVDGVETFKHSKHANSVTAISCYFMNSPYYLEYSGKDMFYLSIVESTKPTFTKDDKDYHELAKIIHDSNWDTITKQKEYEKLQQKKNEENKNKIIVVFKPRKLKYYKNKLKDLPDQTYNDSISYSSLTPSDSDTRSILNLILKDFEDSTDHPFIFLKNKTIYVMKSSVLCFRMDNVATDCVSNSNGKQSSYYPCRVCSNKKTTWNPIMNTFSKKQRWDVYKSKSERTVLHFSLQECDRASPLRLLPIISLLRDCNTDDLLQIIYPNNMQLHEEFYNYYREIIDSLLKFVHSYPHFMWIAPSSEFIPSLSGDDLVKNTGTINPNSFGFVDPKHLVMKMDAMLVRDLMHLYENYFCKVQGTLAFKKKPNTVELESLHEQKLMNDGIYRKGWTMIKPGIPVSVLIICNALISLNSEYLSHHIKHIITSFLPKLTKSEMNVEGSKDYLTSYEKMQFMFCFAPWLFISSIKCPLLSTILQLTNILSKLYNFCGEISEMRRLQLQINILLHTLENEFHFTSLTINDHYMIHLLHHYKFIGPFGVVTCYYPEWNYKRLKFQYATPNVIVSMNNNVMTLTIASIASEEDYSVEVELSQPITSGEIYFSFKSIPPTQYGIRVISCFMSSQSYIKSTTCSRILTLLDIEMISTLSCYLENRFFSSPDQPKKEKTDDDYLPSSTSSIVAFADIVYPPWKDDTKDIRIPELYSSCKYKGHCLSSINTPLSKLTQNIILQNSNAFAICFDFQLNPHLFAILGYFNQIICEESYLMCYVYELPISHFFGEKSSYCFRIDLNNCNYEPVRHIISFDRLNFDDKVFVKSFSDTEIICCNMKINCKQFLRVHEKIKSNYICLL